MQKGVGFASHFLGQDDGRVTEINGVLFACVLPSRKDNYTRCHFDACLCTIKTSRAKIDYEKNYNKENTI